MIEITSKSGAIKQVEIEPFKALDGWEMQRRYIEFAISTDKDFRRAFTLEVLSYAKIIVGANKLPLSTDALIDNHLESWENVEAVFNGILIFNGIDPHVHANRTSHWGDAGAEMAIAFISEASKLIGPALEMVQKNKEMQG